MSSTISQLWLDYVKAKRAGSRAVLPDFSYSGYHYSQSPIPNIEGPIFDVTKYGICANQVDFCDEGISKAVEAAQRAGGGVVYFPPGIYHISSDRQATNLLRITSSHIVVRGAAAHGPQTTTLFINHMKPINGVHQVYARSPHPRGKTLAYALADIRQGDMSIKVDSINKMFIGQNIYLHHQSIALAKDHYYPLVLSPRYKRILEKGFLVTEHHTVVGLDGNKIILGEPIQIDCPIGRINEPTCIKESGLIEEIGFENIRFKGSWDKYPETFVHHKDDIHDYGWEALRMDRVRNGWIRSCVFEHCNTAITLEECCGFTVQDCSFIGKRAHSSVVLRKGYGVLVKDCIDTANHHHGPSTGYSSVSTVYVRFQSPPGQSIDCHSGSPYCTLLDNIEKGGVLSGSGGPIESLPHHGRGLVFWNYNHTLAPGKTGTTHYDFWMGMSYNKRPDQEFCMPIIVGMHGDPVTFKMDTCKIIKRLGCPVLPSSLFEAQLALRLGIIETRVLRLLSLSDKSTTDRFSDISIVKHHDDNNLLMDPSFEALQVKGYRTKTGWLDYSPKPAHKSVHFKLSNSFQTFQTSAVGRGVNGLGAIKIGGTDQEKIGYGATQRVTIGQQVPEPLTLSGWAKIDKVPSNHTFACYSDFYLRARLHYNNGSNQDFTANFCVSTKGWQSVNILCTPTLPIISVEVFCVFAKLPGVARFDDICLARKKLKAPRSINQQREIQEQLDRALSCHFHKDHNQIELSTSDASYTSNAT